MQILLNKYTHPKGIWDPHLHGSCSQWKKWYCPSISDCCVRLSVHINNYSRAIWSLNWTTHRAFSQRTSPHQGYQMLRTIKLKLSKIPIQRSLGGLCEKQCSSHRTYSLKSQGLGCLVFWTRSSISTTPIPLVSKHCDIYTRYYRTVRQVGMATHLSHYLLDAFVMLKDKIRLQSRRGKENSDSIAKDEQTLFTNWLKQSGTNIIPCCYSSDDISRRHCTAILQH